MGTDVTDVLDVNNNSVHKLNNKSSKWQNILLICLNFLERLHDHSTKNSSLVLSSVAVCISNDFTYTLWSLLLCDDFVIFTR